MIIPGVTVVHYWVDAMKVGHGPERGPGALVAFLFDQAVHMAILAGAVLLSGLALGSEVFYGSVTLTAILYYAVPLHASQGKYVPVAVSLNHEAM